MLDCCVDVQVDRHVVVRISGQDHAEVAVCGYGSVLTAEENLSVNLLASAATVVK